MGSGGLDRSTRWVVVTVAFAGFIATLDDYIVAVSLPAIAHDLGATTSEAAQVTLVYLLALVSTLLLFGRLGDRIGFRRVFVSGYAVFVLASAVCSIAPTIGTLVSARFVQGIGAAMLSVTGPALIARYVPSDRRGWAFGLLTTVTALGITLGAPVGGIVSGLLSWRFVFLVNVPIGLAAMVVALRVLPRDQATGKDRGGWDLIGVVLSFTGLLLLLHGLNQGEETGGWSHPAVLVSLLGSAALLTAFAVHEFRTAQPLLAVAALRNRQLLAGILAALTGYMLLAGCNFLLPFYLVHVEGLRTEQVGLVMVVYSVVYVSLSPFMGRLTDRRSARVISGIGMVLAALGCLWLVATVGVIGLAGPITYLVWRAGAYAAFISPNSRLVMDLAARDGQGGVSGILKVAVNLSLALGVVLFEVVFALPLPETDQSLGHMLESGQVTTEVIIDGMVLAYALGAAMCLASAAFALIGRDHRGPVVRAVAGEAAPTPDAHRFEGSAG